MTGPVVHYSASYVKPFTTAEAEQIRTEDATPPSWWRPMPTSAPNGYRQHCGPCDVAWVAPTPAPAPCWNCAPTEEGVAPDPKAASDG